MTPSNEDFYWSTFDKTTLRDNWSRRASKVVQYFPFWDPSSPWYWMFGPNKAAAAIFFEPLLVWTASPTDTTQARGQLCGDIWATRNVDHVPCWSRTLGYMWLKHIDWEISARSIPDEEVFVRGKVSDNQECVCLFTRLTESCSQMIKLSPRSKHNSQIICIHIDREKQRRNGGEKDVFLPGTR